MEREREEKKATTTAGVGKEGKEGAMGRLVKVAVADAVITCMWVFCVSTLGVLTSLISSALQIQGLLIPTLFVTTSLVFILVFVFGFISGAMGGASFNPTGTASFYAAGLGGDSLYSIALRLPAQAAGAAAGALAIMEFMPLQYKHVLGGPSLKVDLHTGAVAEGVLTFIISFAILFIILRGPNSRLLKNWLIAMCTVSLVVAGSGYTGPAMNPANAFGWAYVNNRHNTWEQLYVYWVCPFIGAILAAWTFRLVFPLVKQKKA